MQSYEKAQQFTGDFDRLCSSLFTRVPVVVSNINTLPSALPIQRYLLSRVKSNLLDELNFCFTPLNSRITFPFVKSQRVILPSLDFDRICVLS